MSLPETEAAVLEAYSLISRQKINQYLSEGRVMLLEGDPASQELRSQVAGNRPRPYLVVIPTGDGAGWKSARCDCLAGGLCVHIGASWIAHLRDRAQPGSGAAAERNAALESLRRSLLKAQAGDGEPASVNVPERRDDPGSARRSA